MQPAYFGHGVWGNNLKGILPGVVLLLLFAGTAGVCVIIVGFIVYAATRCSQ